MDKEVHQYAEKELKNIKIKGFEYVGDRDKKNIFVFKKQINDDDACCIVLNGTMDGKVEIEAETDYNSGGDEYIDKIVSFGSWQEAVEYLKNKSHKIIKEVDEKYEYHKKIKVKTARIARRVLQ